MSFVGGSQTQVFAPLAYYRDIKPANLLISPQERDGTFSTKFTDFDSAKSLDEDQKAAITAGMFTMLYLDPHLAKLMTQELMVSFMEYVNHDVFAIALVFYQILCKGEHLFQGSNNMETISKMNQNDRTNLINAKIDELAKNAIWTMTQPNPRDRITMEQAKKIPYFDSKSDLIQGLFDLNEAMINMGRSTKAKNMKEEFNKTFFMVLDCKWKELPFVAPELLKNSKYSDSLSCYLRFVRNLLAHAGQNQVALKKHFRTGVTAEDLLDKVQHSNPRTLVHCHWFAKEFFPDLPMARKLPQQCAKAYSDMMEMVRSEIGDDEAMVKKRKEICPDEGEDTNTASATEESTSQTISPGAVGHDVTINGFLRSLQELVVKSEPNFKSLKVIEHMME